MEEVEVSTYLTCGARWCTRCPNNWRAKAKCDRTEEILNEAERWEQEAQTALDTYDLVHPEDFMNGLLQAEKDN